MLRILLRRIVQPGLALVALGVLPLSAFADGTYGGTDPPPPIPHPVMPQQPGTASIDATDDETALLVAAGRIVARLSVI